MKLIDADAFAEAIENLDWYSLHNGEMIQGAEGEETAYYRASDIYTEINKAVTIRVDLIEPNCADGCIYGWGSDECEKCRFKCEPKRGRWIKASTDGAVFCSECGTEWLSESAKYYKFCPICGARME